jgi:tetratricopeptide (TPR) repeat protein
MWRLKWLMPGLLAICSSPALLAEEPFQQFVDGLRARRFYDQAILYLKQMRTSGLVSDEVKATIAYEQGRTWIEKANTNPDTGVRLTELEQAADRLKEFLDSQPNHPLAPAVKSQRGRVLEIRGRTLVEIAGRSTDPAKRSDYLQQGRAELTEAQTVYAEAEKFYDEAFHKLPKVITPDTPEAKARDDARTVWIESRLNVASALYETGLSYPKEAPEFKKYLNEAAALYQKLYETYRLVIAGQYARMLQARCFQQMGEISRALSYYNDVLSQPDSELTRELKTQTLRLAMQCWMSGSEKERKVDETIAQGTAWIASAVGTEETSAEGVDIQWLTAQAMREKARGLSADDRAQKAESDRLITEYRKICQKLARSPNVYQREAKQALVDIGAVAEASTTDPKSFQEACDMGQAALEQLQAALTLLRLGEDPARTGEYEQMRTAALVEASRRFRQAINLRDDETSADEVNEVRYYLAYLAYQARDYYRAAVVGDFLARKYPESSSAKSAAYIAMASWLQAYQELSADADHAFQQQELLKAAEYLTQRWPNTVESDEALTKLAWVYIQQGRLPEAIESLERIAPESPSRRQADVMAGQAIWGACLADRQLPEATRPSDADLAQRRILARDHLKKGVDAMRASLTGEAVDYPLMAAELVLVQIYVDGGEFDPAVTVLETPSTGILALLAANNPVVNSKASFPLESYKLALRAYVGAGQLDKAEGIMGSLDALASQGDAAAAVTQVYVALGRSLQDEVDRLKQAKNVEQLAKVRATFQAFLERIAQRQAGNTYFTLAWVAQSLKGLAGSVEEGRELRSDDPSRALFENAAATYVQILDRVKADPAFLPKPEYLAATRINLAECHRRLGRYKESIDLLVDVLKDKPSTLEAQRDAARTFQAWGGKDPAHYATAMFGGRKAKKPDGTIVNIVWGWNHLSRVVQPHEKHRDVYNEARFSLVWCRVRQALAVGGPKEPTELRIAVRDITAQANLDATLGGDPWKGKYDSLLKEVQGKLNEPQVGLRDILKSVTAGQAAAGTSSARVQ